MGDLADGVNSSVGPSSALEVEFGAEKVGRGLLELALDSTGVDLVLPAGEPGTVIFQSEFKGLHAGTSIHY